MTIFKKIIFIIVLGAIGIPPLLGDNTFRQLLEASGYVHLPLPLETERSLETRSAQKEVLAEMRAEGFDDLSRWSHEGIGNLTGKGESGVLVTVSHPDGIRACGSADDPDYALYGHSVATFDMGDCNLDDYNRLAVDIIPDCPGARIVNINLLMENSPSEDIANGLNAPTGYHLIHLNNGCPNTCFLEIADLRRDHVQQLRFSISLNGRDMTTDTIATYKISNLRFQRIANPEPVSGWQPSFGRIIYSMTGYDSGNKKTALVGGSTANQLTDYRIIDTETGTTIFTAPINKVTTTIGTFGEIDFTSLDTPGTYKICCGEFSTEPFRIGGSEIWDESLWRVLNFVFCQRCGYYVPGIHSKCHTDLFAVHNGLRIPYSGGWHDAGDLSQQTLQTADVTYALLECAVKQRTSDPVLSSRLQEEALWGLDFVLRSRFGDGYHASSMGLLIWQDGRTDSYDDINSVRVQDVSFDNFLYAGYEAYAAMTIEGDSSLCSYLARVAADDYRFARNRFLKDGLGGFISPYEHTYCTSMSQCMATISWAATQLYRLTGEKDYAAEAVDYIDRLIECQHTEPVSPSCPLTGFFYRDSSKHSIVHFIHQSREQIYAQALTDICLSQPNHPHFRSWLESARLYGQYLKDLMSYTEPYGMIPSGIYRDDEYLDRDGFYSLHLFPPSNVESLYEEQFGGGITVAEHYAVKRFPIWFNIFNGNLAVHTSMGKSAAVLGNYFNDADLMAIGLEQLYWIVGKNPFGQSLIYGEGHDYPALDNFSSGPSTGAIPVGIRSLKNTDEPYWPQINNACYKEVWVTSAGKWLSLLAEY